MYIMSGSEVAWSRFGSLVSYTFCRVCKCTLLQLYESKFINLLSWEVGNRCLTTTKWGVGGGAWKYVMSGNIV